MLHRMLVGALLLGVTLGCAPGYLGSKTVYNHTSNDAADRPFKANFTAPYGGYLFPFHDSVAEVLIQRNGWIHVILYDETGQSISLDDKYTRRAVLQLQTPGLTPDGNNITALRLFRQADNYFSGRVEDIAIIPRIERAMALRFSFVLPNVGDNNTTVQCHHGHWSQADGPKLVEGLVNLNKEEEIKPDVPPITD